MDRHAAQDRQAVRRQRLTAPKDNQMVLVAEENQELCGFVCAYGEGDPQWGTYIDNLHVRRESQRRGIGKRLMI
ncbi:MAG: GNAT family N-acetyltransferase [Acidiferrobacterales bacterium]